MPRHQAQNVWLIEDNFCGQEPEEEPLGPDEAWISPLDLDLYSNNGTETPLHHAVRRKEIQIAHRLLAAGANPNLIIYSTEAEDSYEDHEDTVKGQFRFVAPIVLHGF